MVARVLLLYGFLSGLLATVFACGENPSQPPSTTPPAPQSSASERVLLTFAATEAGGRACDEKLFPEFQDEWLQAHGQEVRFRTSYGDSHSLTLSILNGFEADVVLLSSDADLESLGSSGLLNHDWRAAPHAGDVCSSPIVLVVRKGNPLGIHDWPDLARDELRLVMPDPCVSEVARMELCAVFGAGFRGHAGFDAGNEPRSSDLATRIFARSIGRGESNHSAFVSFRDGIGDVAITPEMEVTLGRMFGHQYEEVVPSSTLRFDVSGAVLDANVEKHGTREAAEAFFQFLFTPTAQKALVFYGFRPVAEDVASGERSVLPQVLDLWPIEEVPSWDAACKKFLESHCPSEAVPGRVRDK